MSLHRGQGLELLWRDSLACPTEEEYAAMVNNSSHISLVLPVDGRMTHLRAETGGLLRVAIKLMMACSTTNIDMYAYLFPQHIPSHLIKTYSDYVPLVNLIGVHFQIRDDYMNLQSTQVCILSSS